MAFQNSRYIWRCNDFQDVSEQVQEMLLLCHHWVSLWRGLLVASNPCFPCTTAISLRTQFFFLTVGQKKPWKHFWWTAHTVSWTSSHSAFSSRHGGPVMSAVRKLYTRRWAKIVVTSYRSMKRLPGPSICGEHGQGPAMYCVLFAGQMIKKRKPHNSCSLDKPQEEVSSKPALDMLFHALLQEHSRYMSYIFLYLLIDRLQILSQKDKTRRIRMPTQAAFFRSHRQGPTCFNLDPF